MWEDDQRDESIDSFFNQTDFLFAKGEDKLEIKNSLKVKVIENSILQGEDINGYIVVLVRSKLAEGRFFLRIECDIETNLDKSRESVTAEDSKDKFKKKHSKESQKTSPLDFKSAIYTLKKFTINSNASIKSDKEINLPLHSKKTKPEIVMFGRSQHKIKSVIERESPVVDPCSNHTKLAIFEWEIFKLEKTIDRSVILYLPFKISLDDRICITTDQVYSTNIDAFENKADTKAPKLPPITEYGNFMVKLKRDQKADGQSNGGFYTDKDKETIVEYKEANTNEYVKISSKITAYYVTNASFAEHGTCPQETRFENFQQNQHFCYSTEPLPILPNYKRLSFKNWKTELSIKLNRGKQGSVPEVIEKSQKEIEEKPQSSIKVAEVLDSRFSIMRTYKDGLSSIESNKDKKKKDNICSTIRKKWTSLRDNVKKCVKQKANDETIVSLSIDKASFSNEEKSLNFVLHFTSELLETFPCLDVLIWAKSNYVIGYRPVKIDKILIQETFSLRQKTPKMLLPMANYWDNKSEPRKSGPDSSTTRTTDRSSTMEYLNQMDISLLTANFQTIRSSAYNFSIFAEFYLSYTPYDISVKLAEKELQIFRLPDDFIVYDNDYIDNIYVYINRLIFQGPDNQKRVLLPYTHISLDHKYGDDLKDDK